MRSPSPHVGDDADRFRGPWLRWLPAHAQKRCRSCRLITWRRTSRDTAGDSVAFEKWIFQSANKRPTLKGVGTRRSAVRRPLNKALVRFEQASFAIKSKA